MDRAFCDFSFTPTVTPLFQLGGDLLTAGLSFSERLCVNFTDIKDA